VKEELLKQGSLITTHFTYLFTKNAHEFKSNAENQVEMKDFLNYLRKKRLKDRIPLFLSNKSSYFLKPYFKNEISFSFFLRNLFSREFTYFLGNRHFYNIHLMGLRYYLLEFDEDILLSKIPPNYLIEVNPFEVMNVLILVSSTKNAKNIRNNFIRIDNLRLSRSLALYMLRDHYSINVKKKVGEFPVIEKKLKFKNTGNFLNKFKNVPKFYEQHMIKWPTFIGREITSDDKIFSTDFEEFVSLKTDNILNKLTDRFFLTNFPGNQMFIYHNCVLLLYIKLIGCRKSVDFLKSEFNFIRDFIQFWSDRAYIWETDGILLVSSSVPFGENTFINNIRLLLGKLDTKFIFLHSIYDFGENKTKTTRYRNALLFPDLKTFDKNSFSFDVKIPSIKQIKKDLAYQKTV
jgi:hypothetical protein